MTLFAKDGPPKLVPGVHLSADRRRLRHRVYTDVATLQVGPGGARRRETFGMSFEELQPGSTSSSDGWTTRPRRLHHGRRVRPVAGPGPAGDHLLQRPPTTDEPERGRRRHRHEPRRGPSLPAHPGRAGVRPYRRQALRAHPAGAPARHGLPLRAGSAAARSAAPRTAVGAGSRVHLGGGARRHRYRLRRTGRHSPDHDGGDHRGNPLPGLCDVDGTGAARARVAG